ASSIMYTALHLRPGVRDWYLQWLARDHPELMPRYLELYATGAYAPKDYRIWLAARIKPLIRAHGLQRGLEDPATGGVRSTALGRPAAADAASGGGSGAGADSDRFSGAGGSGRGTGATNPGVRRALIAEELPPELNPTLF
ncbi:MAG: hypothetical protein H7311_09300, partial [Ramlibacter sp.]|nr:hypothetical protein [Cryobacterium sp.]